MLMIYYNRIKKLKEYLKDKRYVLFKSVVDEETYKEYILSKMYDGMSIMELIFKEHPELCLEYIIPMFKLNVLNEHLLKVKDMKRNTLLMMILCNNPKEYVLIEELIKLKQGLLKKANEEGMTPLAMAIVKGDLFLVKLFLYYKAPIDFVMLGMSGLVYAKYIDASKEIIKKMEEETLRLKRVLRMNEDVFIPLDKVIYLKDVDRRIYESIRQRRKRKERFERWLKDRVLHSKVCFGKYSISKDDQYKMARYYDIKDYTNMDLEETCKAISKKLLQHKMSVRGL